MELEGTKGQRGMTAMTGVIVITSMVNTECPVSFTDNLFRPAIGRASVTLLQGERD
jgi:hypothetical protein